MLRAQYRAAARAARNFSTAAPNPKASSSNLPLLLCLGGVAGLSVYTYLSYNDGSLKKMTATVPLTSALKKDAFIPFEVKHVESYNHNSKILTLALPAGQASLLPVASAVLVRSADENAVLSPNGKPVIRPYTPISDPAVPGEITFVIKKYDTGQLTPHIHSLQVGDKLALKGPIPKWPYQTNEFDEVALIGGGSGITPLYQVVTHALRDPSNKTKFKLLYSNVTPADILLKKEFEELKAKHPDTFDYVFLVDKPDKTWTGPSGFINQDILKKNIAPPTLNEKVKVFVCGPPAQVAAIAGPKDKMEQGKLDGALKKLGYTENQVYKF